MAATRGPINRALSSWHGDVGVVTKVGPGRDPSGEWLTMARPDQLRGQVEEDLRQLGRDCLDVANLRVNGPRTASIAEHFGALAELREAGLIRHLGLSAVLPEHVTEAQTIAPVVCVQNSYGLDWRRGAPGREHHRRKPAPDRGGVGPPQQAEGTAVSGPIASPGAARMRAKSMPRRLK